MLQSEPTKFSELAAHAKSLTARLKLPAPVAAIYRAVHELEAAYPGRKFTPDLVGSIGEVVAAEALDLNLYRGNHPLHEIIAICTLLARQANPATTSNVEHGSQDWA